MGDIEQFGRTRTVGELADELASAGDWPRTRPARLISGSRSLRVRAAAICADMSAVETIDDPSVVALLATPPGADLLRRGRRASDLMVVPGGAAEDPAHWTQVERAVLDASELLAGSAGGFDDLLGDALGLDGAAVLVPVDRDELKFVGFVPEGSLAQVRAAVFAAGAGVIGDYTECSWSTAGTGTFRGGEASDPAVGTAGPFEQVAEVRFETVVPAHLRTRVSRAYVRAHPYEEPAFEVYSLQTPARVGIGRLGTLAGSLDATVARLHQGGVVIEVEEPADGAVGEAAAVTTERLDAVLHEIVADASVALVVCSSASDAERELLLDRGMTVVVVDRTATVKWLGDQLAARLSRALGMRVQLAASLEFPHSGSAAGGNGSDAGSEGATVTQLFPRAVRDAPADAGGDLTRLRLWSDGGSRGNPGPAAAAYVLRDPQGADVEAAGVALGTTTNNVAEYRGLIDGLRRATELGARELEVFMDSELIVKQVLGQYRVRHPELQPLHKEVMQLLGGLDRYSIEHVPRAQNATADALVNETLDSVR